MLELDNSPEVSDQEDVDSGSSIDRCSQHSSVDCVKLAGRKVSTWYLRQHPKGKYSELRMGYDGFRCIEDVPH